MERDNPLCGMYALTALRLCQMGCIGPHLPFNSTVVKNLICLNLVSLDIGAFENKFLLVLANCIEIVHPHNQSVWVICEAAGQFMRQLNDPKMRKSVYEIITHDHLARDKDKLEKVEVEYVTEDEYIMEDEDMDEDENKSERRDEKRELIDNIIVRIPKSSQEDTNTFKANLDQNFSCLISHGQRFLENAGVNWQNSTMVLPWQLEAEQKVDMKGEDG
ncbi:hypothetical protein BT63DRAFT_139131 [Microthyrium microscopicum]|uniref:Uncharacterized protein n=1 Tax=Microthyrium microscopicum TaxID=703497 RepID=A0A6A6UKV9_9PEZI|nr:hypothetical protein BT63DRAFT_139131 [Microthyrium microscopicum]